MSRLAELLTELAKRYTKNATLDVFPSGALSVTVWNEEMFLSGNDETELILKLTKYLLEAKETV